MAYDKIFALASMVESGDIATPERVALPQEQKELVPQERLVELESDMRKRIAERIRHMPFLTDYVNPSEASKTLISDIENGKDPVDGFRKYAIFFTAETMAKFTKPLREILEPFCPKAVIDATAELAEYFAVSRAFDIVNEFELIAPPMRNEMDKEISIARSQFCKSYAELAKESERKVAESKAEVDKVKADSRKEIEELIIENKTIKGELVQDDEWAGYELCCKAGLMIKLPEPVQGRRYKFTYFSKNKDPLAMCWACTKLIAINMGLYTHVHQFKMDDLIRNVLAPSGKPLTKRNLDEHWRFR